MKIKSIGVLASCIFAISAFFGASSAHAVGQFIIKLNPSHVSFDDPIVFPGQPGAAHAHEFVGNKTTNAFSTYESMVGQATSSVNEPQDSSAQWFQEFYFANGQKVNLRLAFRYYTNRPSGSNPIRPFPPNLKMIAGGPNAPLSVSHWKCFDGNTLYLSPPNCSGNGNWLVSKVMFPQCWDGVNLDSPDHRSHMAYASGSSCPSSHPVKVGQIMFFNRYGDNLNVTGSYLSADGTRKHGDYWNTWVQPRLEELYAKCLAPNIMCGANLPQ